MQTKEFRRKRRSQEIFKNCDLEKCLMKSPVDELKDGVEVCLMKPLVDGIEVCLMKPPVDGVEVCLMKTP